MTSGFVKDFSYSLDDTTQIIRSQRGTWYRCPVIQVKEIFYDDLNSSFRISVHIFKKWRRISCMCLVSEKQDSRIQSQFIGTRFDDRRDIKCSNGPWHFKSWSLEHLSYGWAPVDRIVLDAQRQCSLGNNRRQREGPGEEKKEKRFHDSTIWLW